jgi:anti-anti-sigma factor
MEIKTLHTGDDYTHIALSGKLDNLAVGEIEQQFLALTAERGQGAVIDISEVSFTGSNGLRLILRAVKALRPLKKAVVLLNPNPHLKAVLLDAGMQDAVIIESDLESAVAKAKA